MTTFAQLSAAAQSAEDRTLLATLLDALPKDPASLAILAAIVGVTILVVVYGRKDGGGGADPK